MFFFFKNRNIFRSPKTLTIHILSFFQKPQCISKTHSRVQVETYHEEPPIALNLVLQVESLNDQVVMLQNELATSAQPSTHLPCGWTQDQDDDKQTYYVNRVTCTSQWGRHEVPPHAFWLAIMSTLWHRLSLEPYA